ncbi:hypothetical protein ACO0QE_001288 [Hanseniaspora vineae]
MQPSKLQLICCFIGANLVGLGSGTIYVYSFYAPQLLHRCNIPISQSSTLSFAITIGSSAFGLLVGVIIDKVGPQIACFIGTVTTFAGYYILYLSYLHRYSYIYLLSLALVLVGLGSMSGFYSAIKCCTTNFPNHRGTAAAVPVAIYALAGVLYSTFCKWYFGENILGVFKFFMIVCSSLIFAGCLTLKVWDPKKYTEKLVSQQQQLQKTAIDGSRRNSVLHASDENGRTSYDSLVRNSSFDNNNSNTSNTTSDSNAPHISKPMSIKAKRTESAIWSRELVGSLAYWGWGKVRDSPGSGTVSRGTSFDKRNSRIASMGSSQRVNPLLQSAEFYANDNSHHRHDSSALDMEDAQDSNDETWEDHQGMLPPQQQQQEQEFGSRQKLSDVSNSMTLKELEAHSSTRDIPLSSIIISKKFIGYYLILAILQGVGQMYIYSVGFLVATQLATHEETTNLNQETVQSIQVSLIATMSFLGRLSSGPLSDFLVKKFKAQRKWCIFLAALLMAGTSVYASKDPSSVHTKTAISDVTNLNTTPDFVKRISISSVLFGLAFGFTFGTFPATIADAFGTNGFSTIWGLATTGGLISVKYFTSVLANDLASHSDLDELHHDGVCRLGSQCYMHTFRVSACFSLFAAAITLYMIFIKYRYRKARVADYRRRSSM